MKEGFRQSMAWLHTWTGLTTGWVLFFIFVTGTAGYFLPEINRWMRPELPLHSAPANLDHAKLTELGMAKLAATAPDANVWTVHFPHEVHAPNRGWQDFAVEWRFPAQPGQRRGAGGELTLDPETAEAVTATQTRDTGGGRLLNRMHFVLHYVDRTTGVWLVGVCTMLMLVAIITGVITHKKIFKDFFTFRPGKGQRSWLDAHNVISVMALPFFLMITYSGLVIYAGVYMPAPIAAVYGDDQSGNRRYFEEMRSTTEHLPRPEVTAPVTQMLQQAEQHWGADTIASVSVRHLQGEPPSVAIERIRGDQVRAYEAQVLRFDAHSGELLSPVAEKPVVLKTMESFRALHEAKFAGLTLRWLFFVAGLLGCGMIGTGLVLWTVKRRRQYQGQFHFGFRLVEALNVATIAGLPAAVAAYFWANRLLPVEMADRAAWEANALFLVWGELFLYACFRDLRKCWVELFWFSAAAFALLPVLNALTTDRHLGITLPAGDWALAGFDLTMLGLGALCALLAVKVRRHWLKPSRAAQPLPVNVQPQEAV